MLLSKKELFAVILGTMFETFDYLLYAYFAPVFASQFFPNTEQHIALILSFVIFAGGFAIRPIGGLFIGYIGDRFGRKKALITTVSLLCIAAFSMAFLPTYKTIGLLAPFLLTVIRLLQGLALSGEINSAASYLAEQAPPQKRCFYISFIASSASFGVCLAALVAFIAHSLLSPTQLHFWGWRLPFVLTGVLALISGVLRYSVRETKMYKNQKSIQIKKLFLNYKIPILQIILFGATLAIGNYYLFALINQYLMHSLGFEAKPILFINFVIIFSSVCLIPFFGYLSDRFGIHTIFRLGLLGFTFGTLPIFMLLSQHSLLLIFIGEFIFMLFLSMTAATIFSIMVLCFPVSIRISGGGIAYNTSQSLFGGTAPALALWLIHLTDSPIGPALYLSLVALMSVTMVKFRFLNTQSHGEMYVNR